MNSGTLFKDAIDSAVCWWADSAKNTTEEQRDAFKDILRKEMLCTVRNAEDPFCCFGLASTELGLGGPLLFAADSAGIAERDFPRNVTMFIRYDLVSVSDGKDVYGGLKPFRDIFKATWKSVREIPDSEVCPSVLTVVYSDLLHTLRTSAIWETKLFNEIVSGGNGLKFTHWTPLPDPPKCDENKKTASE